jgi:hypothetical protein
MRLISHYSSSMRLYLPHLYFLFMRHPCLPKPHTCNTSLLLISLFFPCAIYFPHSLLVPSAYILLFSSLTSPSLTRVLLFSSLTLPCALIPIISGETLWLLPSCASYLSLNYSSLIPCIDSPPSSFHTCNPLPLLPPISFSPIVIFLPCVPSCLKMKPHSPSHNPHTWKLTSLTRLLFPMRIIHSCLPHSCALPSRFIHMCTLLCLIGKCALIDLYIGESSPLFEVGYLQQQHTLSSLSSLILLLVYLLFLCARIIIVSVLHLSFVVQSALLRVINKEGLCLY